VQEPQPLVARPREPVIPDRVDWSNETGRFILADVRHGRSMEGVAPGEIKKLLVLEILPKPINFSGGSDPLAERGSFFIQRILGTVPVEADGSACFDAPAMRPIFFVALDEKDLSVKRMQSFTSAMPGETVGCAGCHENRQETARSARVPLALRRVPSRIEPVAHAPPIIDLARHVQPILDRHCVSCHNYDTKRDGGVALVGDRGPIYAHSYTTLIHRRQIADGGNGVGDTPPRQIGSSASAVMRLLDGSHHGAKLSDHERTVVRLWIDSGAIYAGTYAALNTGHSQVNVFQAPAKYTPEQQVLKGASLAIRARCVECHRPHPGNMRPGPTSMPAMQTSGGEGTSSYFARVSTPAHAKFSPNILFNLSRPARSPILLGPLAKHAGGWGACGTVVFRDTADADYQKILAAIEQARDKLEQNKRFDMPGFRPGEPYVREMKRYGILPASFDPADPADVYAIDERYWQSFWWRGRKESDR
jgi:mono/diheme cytochrome c family protein